LSNPGPRTRSSILISVVVLIIALTVPFFATGCGAESPDAAVREFYKAIETHNWNAYLASVLPNNVRRMTQTDTADQKKKFLENDFKYIGLKLKTTFNKSDKDKAEVELTAGVIKGKNPTTGKEESTTIAEIKKTYGITPTINTEKYKGTWYVDVPLASADRPTQTQ
jgi:uncharacterized protein YchJ